MITTARFIPILALVAAVADLPAQSVLRPASSSRATTEVALSAPQGTAAPVPAPGVIRIDYGQPHLRGRSINTDSLVPFDKPWRLGANANTTLTTDVDILLGDKPVAKGTYVLYAIPSRTSWTLVVQRNVGQTAAAFPDSADVARISLRHTTLSSPAESLTMWLIPSTQPGPARGELRFAWGTSQLSTSWAIR